ncbi:hypothetical protein NIES4106_32990 [Fischerella sp. NIES-4106]|jgi:hypothetical protein|nr:hypothetical protein NIES4106_32990 [Fischerella sp. NIES-4106]
MNLMTYFSVFLTFTTTLREIFIQNILCNLFNMIILIFYNTPLKKLVTYDYIFCLIKLDVLSILYYKLQVLCNFDATLCNTGFDIYIVHKERNNIAELIKF